MWKSKHSYGIVNLVIGKALRVPLWFLVTAALARFLGPEGLGRWSMVLAAGMLLNQIFLHWTQSITLRFSPSESEKQGVETTLLLRLPLLLFFFLLAIVMLAMVPENWMVAFVGFNERWAALLALLSFWAMAETQSLQQVRERFLRLAWSPIWMDLLLLGSVFFIAFALDGELFAEYQGVFVLLFVLLFGWFSFLARELLAGSFVGVRPDFSKLRPMVLFALPLIPGFLIAYFSEWVDYFLIRYLLNEGKVGVFHAGYQYLLVLIGIPTALVSVVLPGLVRIYDAQGEQGLRQFMSSWAPGTVLIWGALIMLPLALLPWVSGVLLGPEYTEVLKLLCILLIAVPGAMVQHVYGVIYFLRGKLFLSTFLFFGIKLSVDFCVAWNLLPRVGLEGAGWSVAVSYLVLQWCFMLFAKPLCAKGIGVLVMVQLFGMVLFCFDHVGARLVVASLMSVAGLFFFRKMGLIDKDTLRKVFPFRFGVVSERVVLWALSSKKI